MCFTAGSLDTCGSIYFCILRLLAVKLYNIIVVSDKAYTSTLKPVALYVLTRCVKFYSCRQVLTSPLLHSHWLAGWTSSHISGPGTEVKAFHRQRHYKDDISNNGPFFHYLFSQLSPHVSFFKTFVARMGRVLVELVSRTAYLLE